MERKLNRIQAMPDVGSSKAGSFDPNAFPMVAVRDVGPASRSIQKPSRRNGPPRSFRVKPRAGGFPKFKLTGIALSVAMLFLGACSATPDKPRESPGVVFHESLGKTHKAAIDALVVLGFDVEKQEPTYVEGFRPRKVGLLVGSGGETVGVWLESMGNDQTRVRVQTAKSLVGIVGQQSWDEEVMKELRQTLNPL